MTCPIAWTPASVRPAPAMRTGSSQTCVSARSSSPCTVRAPSWIWNPAKAVPS